MYNKIGIIGAMEEEVAILIDEMKDKKEVKKAGMVFYNGILGGKDVVVVMSGIGKINAAICSQILIDVFEVDTLINTGVAGGLYEKIKIGDIVISKDVVNHDMDTTGFGYEYGYIPRMNKLSFEADEKLIQLAKKACEKTDSEIGIFEGRVLSGDQFISDEEKKDWLISTFNGYCAEMEGVSIAQTAFVNELPFVVIRAISDNAHGEAEMDYEQFKDMAVKNLSKAVITMLELI